MNILDPFCISLTSLLPLSYPLSLPPLPPSSTYPPLKVVFEVLDLVAPDSVETHMKQIETLKRRPRDKKLSVFLHSMDERERTGLVVGVLRELRVMRYDNSEETTKRDN